MSSLRQVRLPALSATMEQATLLHWLVAPGDEVTEGQAIAEVSTDKVDMDLEAPFAGTIEELLAEESSDVALGAVLATISTDSDDLLGGISLGGEDGEEASFQDGSGSQPEPVSSPEPSADVARTDIVPASPPARVLARRLGVELRQVTPTGRRGQVTPADVQGFAQAKSSGGEAQPAQAETPTKQVQERIPEPAPSDALEARRRAVRKATAEIMGRSATIPQFTLYRILRLDRTAERRSGRSWTTELVRAMAASLRDYPELNARWDEEASDTVPLGTVSVGLAVDRPGIGLAVATIVDPDQMGPEEADQAIRALADRARAGKLRPEDMHQASITLSNLGGIGVDRFDALLIPPQAAIMSAGTVRHRPVVTGDGGLAAALTLEVGLTVDHRVADGADGARYLDTFADRMEGQL